jgi:glycine cleavage system H protein
MSRLLFSKDHEYIRVDGDTGTVGITDYAQKALGDVVYVELPKPGAVLTRNGQAGVVESVKSASEIYAPVSGTVTEINAEIADDTARVNSDPMDTAWFFKMSIADAGELDGLMDEAAYAAYCQGL